MKRKLRKYTQRERDEAILLYQGGWSMKKVEKLTGVNASTLRGWLERDGIPRRGPREYKNTYNKRSHAELDLIVKLYNDGHSTGEIGPIMNRHPSSIVKALAYAGVKTRSVSEGLKIAYAKGRRTPNAHFGRTPSHLTTR